MIRLKIIEIDDYIYTLEDESNNKYSFDLEFFDIEEQIEVGNYINIAPELLNKRYEGYSSSYTFGNLDNKYGKKVLDPNDVDLILIETEEKNIVLKRLYG